MGIRSLRLLANVRQKCKVTYGLATSGVRHPELFRHGHIAHTRCLNVSSILAPPLIFTGLFLGLWAWKCTMLIVFQNAIIYNPFLPPNARTMRIADFSRDCGGIRWREERISSLDGTSIALCVAEASPRDLQARGPLTPVYILYFQGNASSLPPRLPDISWILRRLLEAGQPASLTMVCVSYRGFWTSHDRPSEKGIDEDCEAALRWVSQLHWKRAANQQLPEPVVILWGQSIGCGFATNLAARPRDASAALGMDALILETPFTSTRAMLKALYPQKWLPYQYLWPFLRSHLNSYQNLGTISERLGSRRPEIYIVEAGQDELVPADHSSILQARCVEVGLPVVRHTIRKALHNEVMVRPAGKQAIAQAISSAIARAAKPGPPRTTTVHELRR